MKSSASSFLKSSAKSGLLGFLRLCSPGLGKRASILMYHSVGENQAFFTVKPEAFESQMRYLSEKGFKLVRLSELVRSLRAGESIASQVAVTFDDAYRDVYENAFPVLKKYKIPATIFIPTGLIGKFITASGGVTLPIMTEEMMKEMLAEQVSGTEGSQAGSLIEFMPHGVTHREFSSLSVAELAEELSAPQQALRALGSDGSVVAYPRGKFNDAIVGASREFYQAGVTVNEGLVLPADDPYRLRRNSIDSSTTMGQFKAKVSGAIELYQNLKASLSKESK